MKEASRLGPNDSLRPHTYVALIGLLASSGLRVGEALRLKVEEIRLSCSHPHLQVVQTKFRKSRLVPLHPSCAEKIAQYAAQRKRLGYDALSDALFVSEWGDSPQLSDMSPDLLWACSPCRDLQAPLHWQTWYSFPSPC